MYLVKVWLLKLSSKKSMVLLFGTTVRYQYGRNKGKCFMEKNSSVFGFLRIKKWLLLILYFVVPYATSLKPYLTYFGYHTHADLSLKVHFLLITSKYLERFHFMFQNSFFFRWLLCWSSNLYEFWGLNLRTFWKDQKDAL